ncbi:MULTISPECIES: ABC transporter permease [unclassified Crossiella]|uniref:FtsX-like permease family protein n=1 Tax=unclassified Crossiella TaxID=2620835 RepID=UPI001FFFC31B|nr:MULTISPECIES: ABC transporter permease [unclassified Crossiella]MCK2239799.1 ABC transporter permease [Crossiella sp. S99.2]MCK2252494.1 ABC transporter permease [Crossiella sp. S99.1]
MNFTRTYLRGVLRSPLRLLLTGLAIAVAALFATGAIMARDIALRTAIENLTAIPASADAVVASPAGDGVTALDRLARTPGATSAVGRAHGRILVGDNTVQLHADPGAGPLSRVRLTTGAYPAAAGEIALSERAAHRLGVTTGGTIEARIGAKPVRLKVTGLVSGPPADGIAAYAPDRQVLTLTGAPLARVELTGDQTRIVESLRTSAETAVPAAQARAAELGRAQDSVDQLTAALTAFVLVALLAGVMVATSAFRIVFAHRGRQLALLRAVGGSRTRLAMALIAEGALTGLVCGALGAALGYGLGWLAPLVAPVSQPSLSPLLLLVIAAGAMLVTIGAVLAPALGAAGVSPLEALRRTSKPAESKRTGRLRIAIGVLAAAGAGGLVYLMIQEGLLETARPGGRTADLLLLTVAGGALALGAVVALGPLYVGPLLRLLERPAKLFGPTAVLAVRGVGGAPRRAAAVAAVVTLGSALLTGALVGGTTLREYTAAESAASYPSDLLVSVPEGESLPAGLVDKLRARPEFRQVLAYREVRLDVRSVREQVSVQVSDVDIRATPGFAGLRLSEGSWEPGGLFLSDNFARRLRVGAGDLIQVGGRELMVQGVVLGERIAVSAVVLDRADLDRLNVPPTPSGALLAAAGPGNAEQLTAQSAARNVVGQQAELSSLTDRRADQSGLLDLLTLLALCLIGLTVLIAIVGVGTTAALSVVERGPEAGLLRALGLGRGALAGATLGESVVQGLLGGLLGVLLGVPYGWLGVQSLGTSAPFVLPVLALSLAVLALVGLTAVAGLIPAVRTARVSPVTAMRAND